MFSCHIIALYRKIAILIYQLDHRCDYAEVEAGFVLGTNMSSRFPASVHVRECVIYCHFRFANSKKSSHN